MLEVIKEYVQNCIFDIKTKTAGMSRGESFAYVMTYYWYHILGMAALVGLLFFLIIHFAFGNKKPVFTCVLVNQEINYSRDSELADAFAGFAEVKSDRIDIDSNYNMSYGNVKLEGVNESSYEKFFFKWRNQELDAVILPESFYKFCKEMGGEYLNLDDLDTGELPLYEDGGKHTGILIDETEFGKKWITNETGEKLLLVFPSDGKHEEMCRKFVEYMNQESGSEKSGATEE